MYRIRPLIFSALTLLIFCEAALAQRPGREFRNSLRCELAEPKTKLEEFETRYGTVVIKGFTQIATLNARDGEARVDAIELSDMGNSTRASGIVIIFRD